MKDAVLAPAATAAPGWWRREQPARAAARRAVDPAVRGGTLAFVALVLFTIVHIAAPQQFFPGLQPLRLALLTGGLAIALHVRDRWSQAVKAPHAPEVTFVLLLFAWSVVTVPFSYWPGGSIGVLTDMFAKSVVLFFLLAGTVTTMARVRGICWVLAGCTTLIGASAVMNYVTGETMEGTPNRIAGYGTSALAGNPNDLALLLNLFLPLVVALVLTARRPLARVASAAAMLVAMAGTVATFSRAGFLTLAAVGAMYLLHFLRRGAVGWVAGFALVGLLAVAVAPPSYFERLATITDITADRTGSAQNRWEDTRLAAMFVLQHPLIGAGIGMDLLALNEMRGDRWLSVHNVYLNYAVDLGMVGLGLFLGVFVAAVLAMLRIERGGDDDLETVARALRISLLAFAIGGFFHPVAYHPFFYYIAGLAVAVRRIGIRRAVPADGRE